MPVTLDSAWCLSCLSPLRSGWSLWLSTNFPYMAYFATVVTPGGPEWAGTGRTCGFAFHTCNNHLWPHAELCTTFLCSRGSAARLVPCSSQTFFAVVFIPSANSWPFLKVRFSSASNLLWITSLHNPHTSLSCKASLRYSLKSHCSENFRNSVRYCVTVSFSCWLCQWNLNLLAIMSDLGLRWSFMIFTRTLNDFSAGFAGASRFRSRTYALPPMTVRSTVTFLALLVIPFAAKNRFVRLVYITQLSTCGLNGSNCPSVAATVRFCPCCQCVTYY